MSEFETPHFKLPSPTEAGEAKNGATDIKELAEAVDTLLFEARGHAYGAQVTRASGKEELPSATHATEVVLEVLGNGEATTNLVVGEVFVGGTLIGRVVLPPVSGKIVAGTITFCVPPGVKWKVQLGGSAGEAKSSYRTLL